MMSALMDLPWQIDLMVWVLIAIGVLGSIIMAFSKETDV